MDIYLFSILLLVAIILLLLTFFKKQLIVGIFTGIFFAILGVILWNGITFVSQTNVVHTGSDYVITNNYSEWSNPIFNSGFTDNELVGTCFILFGLFMLLISGVMLFSEKKTFDLSDTYQEESDEN